MIIHYKNTANNSMSLIKLNSLHDYGISRSEELFSMYCKLSFAKNNKWTYIFGNKSISDTIKFDLYTDLLPVKLPLRGIANLISVINPSFNGEETNNVLKKLYEYKKWLI